MVATDTESKETPMATEPTYKDTAVLDAKIKELMKRSESLHASIDEMHAGADAAKAAAAAKAKALAGIKPPKR